MLFYSMLIYIERAYLLCPSVPEKPLDDTGECLVWTARDRLVGSTPGSVSS